VKSSFEERVKKGEETPNNNGGNVSLPDYELLIIVYASY